jgi:hypothetical protein
VCVCGNEPREVRVHESSRGTESTRGEEEERGEVRHPQSQQGEQTIPSRALEVARAIAAVGS